VRSIGWMKVFAAALVAAMWAGTAGAQSWLKGPASVVSKGGSSQAAARAERRHARVTSVPREPENLGLLKDELKKYHACTCTCGCYETSLAHQDAIAIADLERAVRRAPRSEKLALVLDIDETSLTNYPEMAAEDFGFVAKDWNKWAEEAKAPAIPGTLKLEEKAEQLGVAVFFITGRDYKLRGATEKNLREAGYRNWSGLTLRSKDEVHEATIPYKSAARERIVQAGYRIVLNVGDQWSDLKGSPQAEYSVKLPNPYYYIP
jgi:acid phosphatase